MEETFTKEDIYCIDNFGYNTFGDIENLKLRQDKDHLIVEEFEYRNTKLQAKLDSIKEYCEKHPMGLDYIDIEKILKIIEEEKE